MRSFVIFNALTGKPRVRIHLSSPQKIEDQLLPGEDFLETEFRPRTQTIDVSGASPTVVDKPLPPPPTAKELEDAAERERLWKHALLSATPTQIDAWIDAKVTDLSSAKEVLKLLAKIAILGVRR